MSTKRFACGAVMGLAVALGCSQKPPETTTHANARLDPPPAAPAPIGPEVAPMPHLKRFIGFKSLAATPDELRPLVSHVPQLVRALYRDDAACLDDLEGKAFAWDYSGGPMRLWLEFEEKAQATVPARYPAKEDWLAKGESGRVVFWLRRGLSEKMNAALKQAGKPTGDAASVELGLTIRCEGGGVNSAVAYVNPLWFAWADRAFDRDQPWAEVPFHDYHPTPILVMEARERKTGNYVPRRAKLTLKAQRVKAGQ